MKIDRLIGILSILFQRDKVTSQELAEKFEVSRDSTVIPRSHSMRTLLMKSMRRFGMLSARVQRLC